ncbi:related to actin cytoskeleton organization (Cro1) [Lecanosticta acicola]|uniref:Related to actin cytoskeleton organization (Cro1) n=1 Tax=Lecanosticta acicola TaxID=111012 RepID=A0AAI8YXL5_9PEZI|nr:related to actin cytoskeleton organization (Cro1) [Lecanosticta acicola]
MSSKELQDRIAQLLANATEVARHGNLQPAYEALKEASHLDAENAQVKDAVVALQAREQTGDARNLVKVYLDEGAEEDGQRALLALRQKQLPQTDALEVLHLLLNTTSDRDLLDALTGALLYKSIHARKDVAKRFDQPITGLFTQLFDLGEESFKAFASIPLDDAAWVSEDSRRKAQIDLFRLCLAKLIDCDVALPARLMQVIARQLAIAPDNVKDLVDFDVFRVILDQLDIRLEPKLRNQAMLATSKILESTGEKGEQLFGQFLVSEVAKQTNDDMISAFSAAAAVFPMIPAVAAQLFMTDGFVQQLVPNLERNSEAAAHGQRKSRTLEQAALELLSAACVDKACREAIDRYCSPWLRDLSEERESKHKAIAALILAKIKSVSQEEITAKLVDLVLVGDGGREQAVEGLAYTSLQPKIKEQIVANEKLLKRLMEALRERSSAAFGCLTVFSNLTSYRAKQTAEQKKMAQLKAYANQQKPEPDDPLDNDTFVTSRCKKLLDADVMPAIVASCKQTSSPTNIAMAVRTLLALSQEQKHRTKMVQQGAVKLLLQIRERIAKTDKSTSEASIIERNASHTLARLLISVNPSHVFSSSLPASSAVTALIPLLSYDQESEQRDLLPTFEALLALTNLASMEDNSVRDLQIRVAWEKLEELLFSSNSLVQRAGVELICNLMASPSGVAKFADGSNDAKRRMQIVLALADVEDLATRRAAGGALAMLTEWDAAVTAVLEKDRGIGVLLSMCEDESDEMKHRGFACVLNVISAPDDVGAKGVKAVKDAGGAEVLKDALRKTKNPEVLGIGVEVLKKLQ